MAGRKSWCPDRRDMIWIDCNPQAGREMKDVHPLVVLSPRAFNERTGIAAQTAGPEPVFCSFCKKSQHEVRSLIEGGCSRDRIGAHRNCLFICDECVALCAQVNADLIGGATGPENLSASVSPE